MEPPQKTTIQPQEDGRLCVSSNFPMHIAGAELECATYTLSDATFLHSTVTPPRRKCGATKWLLLQLERCLRNEGAAIMFLELLLTNLRSTTFALQKQLSSVDGFSTWYSDRRDEMRKDARLRWIVDNRNAAEKEGLVAIAFGPTCVQKHFRNGTIQTEPGVPTLKVAELEAGEVLDTLGFASEYLERLVEDAHEQFVKYYPDRKAHIRLECVRETPNGSWEHFDPS